MALAHLALVLHLSASRPIDDLHLRECEARNELIDEDLGEARERVLQQWFNGFLPPRDACGFFLQQSEMG